jgi:hypothetical protein
LGQLVYASQGAINGWAGFLLMAPPIQDAGHRGEMGVLLAVLKWQGADLCSQPAYGIIKEGL